MASNPNNTNQPQISQYIRDKANRTRLSIESYYAQAIAQLSEREQRAENLEQHLNNEGKSNILLCTVIITLYTDLNEEEKEARRKVQAAKENDYLRQKRTRLSASDFHFLKVKKNY